MKGKTSKFAIIILIIVLMVVSAMVVFFIKYQTVDNYMTARCYSYLSEKYSVDKSELTLLDHDKKHLYFNDAAIPELEWAPYKWEFEYKGRSFFVNRIDGKYYDDYQLEDIESWCTEWMQQNVDERIKGCLLETEDLIQYYRTGITKNTISIKENDIDSFINEFLMNSAYYEVTIIYYYDTSISIENYDVRESEITSEIKIKIKSILENGDNVYPLYSDGIIMEYHYKTDGIWSKCIDINYIGKGERANG